MGANRKENRQINFRVSEQEYQKLEQMASNAGMSVPSFCKAKSKGARMKSPLIDRQGALQMASELRRIGSNINQIAKHLNSGQNVSDGQIRALQEVLNDLWQQFNSALQGVHHD